VCHKRIETKEIIAPEREVDLLFPGSQAISGQNVIFTHLELHFVCFLWLCDFAQLFLVFLTAEENS